MMLRPFRLEGLLSVHGYNLSYVDKIEKWAAYRSCKSNDPLSKWIVASSLGKRGEWLVGKVAITVTKHKLTAFMGLSEEQLLFDVAVDKDSGDTLVTSQAEVVEWEQRLVPVALKAVEELTKQRGPELLSRTSSARKAVDKYLKMLPRGGHLPEILRTLERGSPSELLVASRRLAGKPSVVRDEGWEDYYYMTCLCLLKFSDRIEGLRLGGDEQPLDNKDLMWRIQLFADHLIEAHQMTTSASKKDSPSHQ
jgi:hypothetical protein